MKYTHLVTLEYWVRNSWVRITIEIGSNKKRLELEKIKDSWCWNGSSVGKVTKLLLDNEYPPMSIFQQINEIEFNLINIYRVRNNG